MKEEMVMTLEFSSKEELKFSYAPMIEQKYHTLTPYIPTHRMSGPSNKGKNKNQRPKHNTQTMMPYHKYAQVPEIHCRFIQGT